MTDSKKDYTVRTYREGDEREIVKTYRIGNIPLDLEDWIWKQKQSPYFDPALVIIAEEDGKVIGIGQAQLRDLKISRTLTIKASQGADLLVLPEHRMRGVATSVTSFLRKNLKAKGVVVGPYGISLPSTFRKFYLKRGGIRVPNKLHCRTIFVKFLSCEALEQKASLVNQVLREHPDLSNRLVNLDLTMFFRIRGFPPFVLKVCRGEVSVFEGEPALKPNVAVIASRLSSSTKTPELVKLLLAGGIKVSGLVRNFLSVYKCFIVMRRVNRILRNNRMRLEKRKTDAR